MSEPAYDPEVVSRELASKLSARTRHVCVLLGAGASRSAGLPDLHGLQECVKTADQLSSKQREQVTELLNTRNLEEALSYLRRLVTILEGSQTLGGFTKESAHNLQAAITRAIIPALNETKADSEPFRNFASWVAGSYYRLPIEIFTINYDLLVETGLESLAVPYFDGFVGSINARFRPELVDTSDLSEATQALPSTFARLWKLHGSVNWEELKIGESRRVVRRGVPAANGATAAIYPSDEKYDQSRRVPFVVLQDRFRRALAMPETVTLVAGYSFGDQHLNEIIFDAARGHPRSETIVLCFSAIPAVLAEAANTARNLTVLSKVEAIIGGERLKWAREGNLAGIWASGAFVLGDFKQLALFLATKARLSNAAP